MSDLQEIIDLSDPITQIKKTIEELGECAEVLQEVLDSEDIDNLPPELLEHVLEELVDVNITTGQIPTILKIDLKRFWAVRKEKINRTIKRFRDGTY